MDFPTWGQLIEQFCSNDRGKNPYYEDFSNRRYNFAASSDNDRCRLIFLKGVLEDPTNKTLRRDGRFIWCKKLKYEGRNSLGFRSISFSVDDGKKRFYVGENNVLCLPSSLCVANHRYFKPKQKTFFSFSTVFGYEKTFKMMEPNDKDDAMMWRDEVRKDNPWQPGTLVAPRMGYFYPDIDIKKINKEISADAKHPCGIILGPSRTDSDYVGKEFYRVRFGNTTYERIHPTQMEIINEV